MSQEWQPISTAPKDGTEILATGFDGNSPKMPRHYQVVQFLSGDWESTCDNHCNYGYLTHWQPLPEPPK